LETYGMQYSEFAQMHPLEKHAHMAFANAIESDRRDFWVSLVESALKSLS